MKREATPAPKLEPGVASRVLAARVLDAVMHRGRSLKGELANALPTLKDPRDRALVEACVLAALRNRARHAAALDAWMSKPLTARDGEVRALLHIGLAQLDPMQLPVHAAVGATVEAVRALGRPHQAGMVNALLRRALREPLPPANAADAWPAWLAQKVREDWGGAADALFEASADLPPLWLRVHRAHASRDEYARQLHEAGFAPLLDDALPHAIRLEQAVPVQQLPGFAQGAVAVQDGSAQQVAEMFELPANARVLDACAAPGGKAAHLQERWPDARILALDVDARRVRRMQDGFARQGHDRIETKTADALQPSLWWDGNAFDAILIDAPCSATGIVRRQPDVLLHRREADLTALTQLQADMLDALWPLLKPAGVLAYATCSVLDAENRAQIAAFLARTPDAQILPLDARFGEDTGAGHRRMPGAQGMDGFFYARLKKRHAPEIEHAQE